MAVYTGSTVGSLDPVPVTRAFSNTIFEAVAGTYLLQLGHNGISSGSSGMLGISIDRTPPPNVSAFWSPFDPLVLRPGQFFANGFDPAGIGIESWVWEFGDGGTASGPSASHRYFADGDYDVRLTAHTGRPFGFLGPHPERRTHDVAISKLVVPQAASAGQTRSITVTVVANGYDESVPCSSTEVFRRVPHRMSTQWVQVARHDVRLRLTAEDAALMKMTFKAVATINGADATGGQRGRLAPDQAQLTQARRKR